MRSGTLAALDTLQTDFLNPKISEHQGRIVKLSRRRHAGGVSQCRERGRLRHRAAAWHAQSERAVCRRISRIEFRMGVNVGDVIVQGKDIFGDGVNVAARLESIATPGGIMISGSVRDHIGNRLDLAFEDMGEQTLKNIERPIRVYRVGLDIPAARSTKDKRTATRTGGKTSNCGSAFQ